METSDSPLSIDAARTLQTSAAQDNGAHFTGVLLDDNLASGTWDAPGSVGSFKTGGNRPSNGRVSIVRMTSEGDPEIVDDGTGGSSILAGDPRDWSSSPPGSSSIRLKYSPYPEQPRGGNESEQRFYLNAASTGKKDPREIWLSWDMRVPVNYRHEIADSNGTISSGNNQKILRLYAPDGVDGKNTTCGVSIRRNSVSGTSDADYGSYVYVKLGGREVFSDRVGPDSDFIVYPRDQGRWMRIVFNAKLASSGEASDGHVRLWTRWHDEADYVLKCEQLNQKLSKVDSNLNGWTDGYILGAANAPYAEDTEFLITNFLFTTHPII